MVKMSFFDTIRDEVKKEHDNKFDIPKMDPKINPLLDQKEEPQVRKGTSIDFLKEQASRYSHDKVREDSEPEPEPRQMFERPSPPPAPEPAKPSSDDQVVALLREIRDQNREIIAVLREMRDKSPRPSPAPAPSPAPERRFF